MSLFEITFVIGGCIAIGYMVFNKTEDLGLALFCSILSFFALVLMSAFNSIEEEYR